MLVERSGTRAVGPLVHLRAPLEKKLGDNSMKPRLYFRDNCLRPVGSGDLVEMGNLLRDPEVRRFLCDDVALPSSRVSQMLEQSQNLDPLGLGLWILEDKHDQLIGLAGLEPVSESVALLPQMYGGVEPTIALKPKYWGNGIATGALNRLLSYGQDTLGLPRIVAAVDEPNRRSHDLMRRTGFQVIGLGGWTRREFDPLCCFTEHARIPIEILSSCTNRTRSRRQIQKLHEWIEIARIRSCWPSVHTKIQDRQNEQFLGIRGFAANW